MDSLDLARGIYAPGRAVSGLTIRVANKPDVLWRIFKVFSDFNIGVLEAAIPTFMSGASEITLFFIIDFTSSNVSLENIISELRRIDSVLDINVLVGGLEGWVFNTVHFPLTVHDVRCIILAEPALKGMIETLRREMGLGGAAILFHIGSFIGVEVAGYCIKKYDVKDLMKALALMRYLIAAWGWGIIVDARFNIEKIKIELNIRGLWECSVYSGLDSSQSHFFRGFLAGYFSTILNKSISVFEVKCIAKGDVHCEFVIEEK
ncbi:MAG: V4R domain-containing protein [Candidatus Methanomethylicia archaeon]